MYGKENVGVIHFDAHYDAGDARHGHLISHAQPVRRLVDDGHTWWASTWSTSTRWSTRATRPCSNAKQVVDDCMTGIALRKLGLGNRDYLSPLTRRDARR